MKLELTTQEATVLHQLVDLAVKANGLQVAEAAIVLSKKIVAAIQADEMSKPNGAGIVIDQPAETAGIAN